MDGDTSGVNLCKSEVGKISSLLECLNCGRTVAAHCVGREEECTAITAGSEHHCVSGVALDFTGDEVADDDTACAAVDDYYVEHLATVERLHSAFLDLAVERSVSAEEKLLACLAFSIECTRYLCATERTVGEEAAVFACERYTLSHALVDDIV